MTSHRRIQFQILLASALLISAAPTLHAQYLLETGAPTFATTESVPMGFINIANGNLHLEIPITSSPQRGGRPYTAKMVYDSRIWKIVDTGSSQTWQPTNVPGTGPYDPLNPPGWRLLTTGNTSVAVDSILNQCVYGGDTYYWYQYQNHRFQDASGTTRRFPLYGESSAPCHTPAAATTSGPALDATGYWMNGGTYFPSAQEVIAPDGTKEYYRGAVGTSYVWKDANGNFLESGLYGMTVDTLNRMPLQKTTVGSLEVDYAVLNSQGSATVKLYFDTLVSVSTNFGVAGVTEYSGGWYSLRRIDFPNGATYQFTYETSPQGYGLVKSMTVPTGETIQFTHTNFTDAQGNSNRWISTRASGGGTQTYTPATCGTNCNKVTVARPSGNETVYTFTLNNGAWNTLTKAYTGSAGSGTLAMTVQYDYGTNLTNPVSGGAGFIRRVRTTTTMPGPSGDLVKKSEGDYDTFTYPYRGTNYTGSRGNPVAMREYAFGSGSPGALLRQMTMSYLHDSNSSYLARNIVRRLTNSQTQDAAGVKVAEMTATYDSTALTSITGVTHHDDAGFGTGFTLRGNSTVTQRWTGSSYLSTTYTYDTTGQIITTTDPKGGISQISYADGYYSDNGANPPAAYSPAPPPTNAYITQVTMPLSGTLKYGYYYASGRRAWQTDQNNRTTYLHYQDPTDRPTKKVFPGGGWIQNNFTSATHVVHTAAVAAGTFQDQHDSDTLGRPGTGSLNDPEGVTYGNTVYDSSGRVVGVTNPYRTVSDPTYGSDAIQYDGLDRVTRLTVQDGNYTEAFYGAAVSGAGGLTTPLCTAATYGIGYPILFKDETGKKRQNWTDALGRIIEVDEPDASGALNLGTCSLYSVLGNLTQVDQGTQTRLSSYDALSRLTTETSPEAGAEYFYYTTAAGALCSGDLRSICRSTDARSITTTYTYDAENRMIGKSFSNGDPAVSYFYDQTSYNGLTITNGKGRRTGMSDGSGQTAWTYNVEGGVLTERRTIAGITKNISYMYNIDGSVNRITYPSGLAVGHLYNAAGRLTQASCLTTCSGTAYGASATYAPSGSLSSLALGVSNAFPGGITTTYTYSNRLQPVNVKATHTNGTVTLLDLTYNFVQAGGKNNGTVTSLTNNIVTGRSQTFTYDELNRLKTAQSAANSGADCFGQSFSYDRYGNLSSISVTKCSAPTLSLGINNNNQISNSGFSYDLSGNLTADGFSTYTWTAEDQLASTAGVTYTYDGDHRRVKKSNGKLYWYGLEGQVLAESDLSGNIQSEYIYWNGRRIARRDPPTGNTYYYLTDHIGSARLVANSTGGVAELSEFYPFGTERPITDTMNNSIKFADMERDSESGLDHTLYRQYSASLARWLSPDVQRGSPANPQSLNRYPYVLNDPMILTDPLGAWPDFDPYLVGCFPDSALSNSFGCGWDESDPCPPGFVPVYGDPTGARGSPAIETLQSALDYADLRLGPYSPSVLSYELTPNGISISISETDFRMLAAFNPILVEAIPYILVGGRILLELAKIATIALLADIIDSLAIYCKHDGGNIVQEDPRKKTCTYECDDGSTYSLTDVPVEQECPRWFYKMRTIFIP